MAPGDPQKGSVAPLGEGPQCARSRERTGPAQTAPAASAGAVSPETPVPAKESLSAEGLLDTRCLGSCACPSRNLGWSPGGRWGGGAMLRGGRERRRGLVVLTAIP